MEDDNEVADGPSWSTLTRLLAGGVGGRLSAWLTGGWQVAQVVACVGVLSAEWTLPCDQHLRLWLVFVLARLVVRLTLSEIASKIASRAAPQDPGHAARGPSSSSIACISKLKEILDVIGGCSAVLGPAAPPLHVLTA
jgi:hypothetical protein